ncbi:MAG: shikimate kinase AroL [Desulfobacter sp.]|nr:shikimate kinase AroL [Desulfobacter sp.]
MTCVFLIGYRCTGKTTIGKLVAKMLDRPFLDTDRRIEDRFKTSIANMVKTKGWEYFRQQESQTLSLIDLSKAPIVATGGGIVLAAENRKWIKNSGLAVWLDADASTLISRILADPNSARLRPSLTQADLEEETIAMLNERTPLYRNLAHIKINTADHTPEAAADLIKRRLDHDRL